MLDVDMPNDLNCSFCGKEPIDIELLMGSSNDSVHICNECLFTGMIMMKQTKSIDFEALVEAARNHPTLADIGDGSES
jgi:hypothetical protein